MPLHFNVIKITWKRVCLHRTVREQTKTGAKSGYGCYCHGNQPTANMKKPLSLSWLLIESAQSKGITVCVDTHMHSHSHTHFSSTAAVKIQSELPLLAARATTTIYLTSTYHHLHRHHHHHHHCHNLLKTNKIRSILKVVCVRVCVC